MTSPDTFYHGNATPTRNEKTSMWKVVIAAQRSHGTPAWAGLERRSFLFGVAATVVLLFATYGAYTMIRQALWASEPVPVQIDRAYESAIDEFQKIAVRHAVQDTRTGVMTDLAASRREQLEHLESAISTLRSDIHSHDISPLTRSHLRDLYMKKLALLQVMVEQGDIDL